MTITIERSSPRLRCPVQTITPENKLVDYLHPILLDVVSEKAEDCIGEDHIDQGQRRTILGHRVRDTFTNTEVFVNAVRWERRGSLGPRPVLLNLTLVKFNTSRVRPGVG